MNAISWASDKNDPWLLNDIKDVISREGFYSEVVAAGIVYRFDILYTTKEERNQLVKNILAGTPSIIHPAVAWALTWTVEEKKNIEGMAIAWIDLLLDELRLAYDNCNPNNRGWTAIMECNLRHRDELEGVAMLLNATNGITDRLNTMFEILDEAGNLAIKSLPRCVGKANGYLSRAFLVNPGAWWTFPISRGDLEVDHAVYRL